MSKNSKLVVGLSVCFLIAISMFIFLSITNKVNPAKMNIKKVNSLSSSIVVDSLDNPHVSWIELRNISYLKWDGSNWLCIDGSIYDPTNNSDTNPVYLKIGKINSFDYQLSLDSKNYPHMAWFDKSYGDGDVMYCRWNGENWVTASGELLDIEKGNANVSRNFQYFDLTFSLPIKVSLALDSNDTPHLSWNSFSFTNDGYSHINYAKWDGINWVNTNGEIYDPETNNILVNTYNRHSTPPHLVIDSDDYPQIIWNDSLGRGNTSSVSYLRWNGKNWITRYKGVYDPLGDKIENKGLIIVTDRTNGPYLDIKKMVVDSKNNPHIFWQIGADLKYVTWDNSEAYDLYDFETVDLRNYSNPSAVIDTNDQLHLTCTTDNKFHLPKNEIVYMKWENDDFVTIKNEPATYSFRYQEDFLRKDDPGKELIVSWSEDNTSYFSQVEIDSKKIPHLIWFERNNRDIRNLFYIKWNGENWVCADGSVYKPSE